MMAHLGDWHVFNPTDRSTYPKVAAPVQVRFDDGKFEDGESRMFFPQVNLLPGSSINAWRYVKGVAQR
jgi:hypothetical protein